MQFLHLLTTFTGRIGRGKWWLGFIAIIIVSVTGVFAFNPALLDMPTDQPMPRPGIAEVLFGLLMMVPATAITVKRFNDRDRPYWWGYAMGAIGALFTVAPAFGLFVDPIYFTTWETVVFSMFLLLAFAALTDNGFLKGTPGPNRYGPDPLQI